MAYLHKAIASGELPEYTSHDKCVSLGLDPLLFGSNRPDVLWRLKTHWVIVEVDEAQHKGNSYSCERRRELELCNCAGGLPVYVIRFNPDPFKTGSKTNRVKVVGETIAKRHASVVEAIKIAVEHTNPQGLTFKKLFFDCDCVGDSAGHKCNFIHTEVFADHEEFLKSYQ
jgi:very-short-patch-repair endonuclease